MVNENNHTVRSKLNVLVMNASTMTWVVNQAITRGVILGISEILNKGDQSNKVIHS